MNIQDLLNDESLRRREFPATEAGIFLAHAGVAPLPRVAVDAIAGWMHNASRAAQEDAQTEAIISQCRADAAHLLGAHADEIALLGPTSLGLSLVARGLMWRAGDEVIYYGEDYPANVYPWTALAMFGVKPIALQPRWPGVITWDLISPLLTPRTRLVALASCHFLSGYRVHVEEIGARLRERGILFCVDGIQTLGAFPLDVSSVDFLSADSHKWLLGPAGAGIVYVRRECQELMQPALLGSWNVVSPDFVAQETIAFEQGGRRYEPGILNLPGIVGMGASLRMLIDFGIGGIGERLLHLRNVLVEGARAKGYRLYLEEWDKQMGREGDKHRSSIVTIFRPGVDMVAVAKRLRDNKVTASLRRNRGGETFIRLSPHFYNTEQELELVIEVL